MNKEKFVNKWCKSILNRIYEPEDPKVEDLETEFRNDLDAVIVGSDKPGSARHGW